MTDKLRGLCPLAVRDEPKTPCTYLGHQDVSRCIDLVVAQSEPGHSVVFYTR